MRAQLALLVAKTITFILKTFTKNGATAAPGLYALKIDPKLIRHLSNRLSKGTIIVAGTNGKTTTSRMIGTILKQANISYIHNKEGSNLLRGIASTLALKAGFSNTPIADYALWEVDEATLPGLFHEVTPKVVILTNLFRDQLDRYGEVNKIRNVWASALQQLPKDTTVILNADDPSIAHLGHNLQARVIYYGIDTESRQDTVATMADANFCAVCNNPLTYEAIYFSHVGRYKCHKCGFTRPDPEILANNIVTDQKSSQLSIGPTKLNLALPGLYNVYNALAGWSAATELSVDQGTIVEALESYKSAFGRVEDISIGDKTIRLFLVKNPTGFNEVIHTITHGDKQHWHIIIGINDNFADGRDISWLWDVDFEKLAKNCEAISCTGIRAYDLQNRLKYAGFSKKMEVEPDYTKLIDDYINDSNAEKELVILPTYTVMLGLRKYLAEKGHITHYLQES